MIAGRLGITGPWQPEMINYPSFVCGHCQFPHVILNTLVGCKVCAAPYLVSEAMMLSKKGVVTCSACETTQTTDEMPLCCANCRCIQAAPAQPDWRRTYTQFPAWRSMIGYAVTGTIGLAIVLLCLLRGQGNISRTDADGMQMFGLFFGGGPLLIGVIGVIATKLRRRFPSEMHLSCGGFGYRSDSGEDRWFSWAQVAGLEAKQQALNTDTLSAHPDSTATGWVVHTAQERVFFDNRLEDARLLARQIRTRSPFVPLVDLPPLQRMNPWVALLILLGIVLVFGLIIFFSSR